MATTNWLRELPTHPIFKPLTDAPPAHPAGPQRKQRMACRGADLIVAVGQELRIADLVECKEVASRVVGGGSVAAGQLHYKVRSVIFVISRLGSHNERSFPYRTCGIQR